MDKDEDATVETETEKTDEFVDMKRTMTSMKSPLAVTGAHESLKPGTDKVEPGASQTANVTINHELLLEAWNKNVGMTSKLIDQMKNIVSENVETRKDNAKTRKDNRVTRYVMYGGTAVILVAMALGFVRTGNLLDAMVRVEIIAENAGKRLDDIEVQQRLVNTATLKDQDAEFAEEEAEAAEAAIVDVVANKPVRTGFKAKIVSGAATRIPTSSRKPDLNPSILDAWAEKEKTADEAAEKRLAAHAASLEAQIKLAPDAAAQSRAEKRLDIVKKKAKKRAYSLEDW